MFTASIKGGCGTFVPAEGEDARQAKADVAAWSANDGGWIIRLPRDCDLLQIALRQKAEAPRFGCVLRRDLLHFTTRGKKPAPFP
ncbi:hypothetical protein BN77_1485 [Rhizobium mesoamericanum STM3625]|uniref:Uncharacterized protein n=1 Tax=Rhizobium mesoamericanum STM3625 TaxID=1211777 RepID=K0PT88_9HYPH|nr:hypothetical protein BN77_1485 [Rhizobium mesoamericanum STM3625]